MKTLPASYIKTLNVQSWTRHWEITLKQVMTSLRSLTLFRPGFKFFGALRTRGIAWRRYWFYWVQIFRLHFDVTFHRLLTLSGWNHLSSVFPTHVNVPPDTANTLVATNVVRNVIKTQYTWNRPPSWIYAISDPPFCISLNLFSHKKNVENEQVWGNN